MYEPIVTIVIITNTWGVMYVCVCVFVKVCVLGVGMGVLREGVLRVGVCYV